LTRSGEVESCRSEIESERWREETVEGEYSSDDVESLCPGCRLAELMKEFGRIVIRGRKDSIAESVEERSVLARVGEREERGMYRKVEREIWRRRVRVGKSLIRCDSVLGKQSRSLTLR